MNTLPVEVLEDVFGYLNVVDIISCLKVCRRWYEILTGHGSLLSCKDCVLKCSSKFPRAKHLWSMISTRQPSSVVLRNADPAGITALYKHHPSLPHLTINTTPKHIKKILRTVYLFKQLVSLSLHVKGAEQMEHFSIEWIYGLPLLQKLVITGVGSIFDDLLPSSLTHLTLNKAVYIPTLHNAILYITHIEIGGVTDDIFAVLAQSLHNVKVCILTRCVCTQLEFPPSLLKELRVQGNVTSQIKLDTCIMLDKVQLSLNQPLPECILPNTVTELSVRGCISTDTHWFLALSIACTAITKLDLRGYTLKDNQASSLGFRFPKLTHLNLLGSIGKNVDHMYLLALLQEGHHLNTLLCDTPYTCSTHQLRELFPACFISNIDYRWVHITSEIV